MDLFHHVYRFVDLDGGFMLLHACKHGTVECLLFCAEVVVVPLVLVG